MISHHHASIDSLLFSKPFVIMLSILMFHIISVCVAQETNLEGYNRCKSNFVCGDRVNVGYPFWGDHHNGDADSRPEYCGLPGYKLDCKNGDVAGIEILGESYRVLEINPITQVMNITNEEFLNDDDACPAKYPIPSFDSAVFELAPDANQQITLYFDCSDNINIQDQYKFDCQINDTGAGSTSSNDAYFWFDMAAAPGFTAPDFSSCDKNVTVPVMSALLRDLVAKPETLPAVIKQGFNVISIDYAESRSSIGMCLSCKSSAGTCGYDIAAKTPTCFCPSGSTRRDAACAGSTAAAAAPSAASGTDQSKKIKIGVAAAAGSLFTILLVAAILLFRRQRRKNNLHKNSALISRSISPDLSMQADPEKGSSYFNTPIFSYKELEEATNNFDSSRELGDGGFGTVYYGVLKDGRAVAVKRLYENNGKRVEQFMNEVGILSLLRHTNLVSLYGCTSRHSRELLLVYEYVSNGTVADHLHGEHSSARLVTWPIRMSIAIESAGALVYLHASDIVHRDVKTNNILLDKNFHVKVADFGLSRLFPTAVTHVSTAPQGTPGYVDPEYHQCYQLTSKSDVYSFGVVLIELISSKPAVDINRHRHEINLSNMAVNKIHNDALHELVDISLGYDTNATIRRTMTLVAELAFRCLQQDSDARPNMVEVLEVLKEIEVERTKVVKPGEMDIPGKDARLLNNNPPVSPNSVTDKWVSISSTPNTSS